MATKTTNYNLVKPTDNEFAEVSVINENMDVIDVQIKTLDNSKEALIKNTTEKTNLVDVDYLPIVDSVDSSKTKKVSFANLKNLLRTIFATKEDISALNGSLSTEIALRNSQILATSKTIYVSKSGNNTIGDGTQSKPFLTIAKAVESIPYHTQGSNVTINVGAGVYNENVYIGKLGSGNFKIIGNSSADTSVTSLTFAGNNYCSIEKMSYDSITARCDNLAINDCVSTSSVSYGIVVDYNCFVNIAVGTISNKTGSAIFCRNGKVSVTQLAGANNTIALSAQYGGVIAKGWGNTITGITQEQKLYGGEIIEDTGVPTGALPLTGGTLTGALNFGDTTAKILRSGSILDIAYGKANLRFNSIATDEASKIVLRNVDSGQEFKLYGEHNPPPNNGAVSGSYTGDDTLTRTINLGFTPSFVIIMATGGMLNLKSNISVVRFASSGSFTFAYDTYLCVANGFVVGSSDYAAGINYSSNKSAYTYKYIAFK